MSAVGLGSTFAFCLAGFSSAPTTSTDLSACALVRGTALVLCKNGFKSYTLSIYDDNLV